MISVLILTKNEEQDLPGCLASVAWSDDVWVLDSRSTDATHVLAKAAGAHVVERTFDNWSAHQNWALDNIAFRYPWVFYLDADERVSPELAASLRGAAAEANDPGGTADELAPPMPVAFEVQRRDFLHDTWLRHVQMSAFYIRLFRPGSIRYERLVNPVTVVNGPTGRLTGTLEHYPFSKGVGWWIARHNDYSTKEAQQAIANRGGNAKLNVREAFLGRDFATKRKQQKLLFYRLPGRPFLKFLTLYVAKRGFLDGRAGFDYSVLQSIYEYFIVLKTHELESGGPDSIP